MDPVFTVLHEDHGMLEGMTHNIVVTMVIGPLELHHVDFILDAHRQVRLAGFDKIGGITLLDGRVVPKVKSEVRDAMQKVADDTSPWSLCNCQVIDGDGIGAVLLRTILTGINVATQTKWPHRVCRDVKSGATWISQYMQPQPTPAGVEAWAATLDQTFKSRLSRLRAARA